MNVVKEVKMRLNMHRDHAIVKSCDNHLKSIGQHLLLCVCVCVSGHLFSCCNVHTHKILYVSHFVVVIAVRFYFIFSKE